MKQRVHRIFEQVPEGIDNILLTNGEDPNLDPSFFYAIGAHSGLFEGCVVLMHRDGAVDLLSSALEETSARTTSANVLVSQTTAERDSQVIKILGKVEKLGVNAPGISYEAAMRTKTLTRAELVDVNPAIMASRMVKDEAELEVIKKACSIGSRVGEDIPRFVRTGMSEYEASAEINYRMQKRGASGSFFATNASWGPNTAEPHHLPDESKLRKGQAALFDFGAQYRRYGSDITRTYFHGNPTKRQKEMYDVVLNAQLSALDGIRAGMKASDADALARNIVEASPFKGLFIHSLGHSLGLAVHDGGRIGPSSDLILKENMVFTVEPGVYVRGEGGVRIEDDVRITARGVEILTDCPKELQVI